MKATELQTVKAGRVFVIQGELWMTVDIDYVNSDGLIVNLKTGRVCHWADIIDENEEIS